MAATTPQSTASPEPVLVSNTLVSRFWPILILLAVGIVTHLVWFGRPFQVVLDEVYFGKFALAYLNHAYFFDLHPPLGKLIYAATGWLIGLDPGFSFATNGLPFPDTRYSLIRLPAYLAGTLVPLVFYGLARELGISRFAAFVVGMLIAFDNAWLVMSRVASLDVLLALFGFTSLWCYLRYRRVGAISWYFVAVALAGSAMSTKWTGLSFIGLIALLELARCSQWRRWGIGLLRLFALAAIPTAIYLLCFAAHFALLDHTGENDTVMSPAFQATLSGNPLFSASTQVKSEWLEKFVETNRLMFDTSNHMTAVHPYGSKWYQWPLMLRTLDFWAEYREPLLSRIYLLGNPVVWWTSAYCILYLLVNFVPKLASAARNSRPTRAELLLIAGYLANLLPFTQIKRVMFLYHYFPALGFAILAVGLLLDRTGLRAKQLGVVLILLSLLAFLYFSPLTYGFPLTHHQFDDRFWIESWR